MKQIGKVLLIVLILFMYIGIIYFGVHLVLKDAKVEATLTMSNFKVGVAMEKQRTKFQSVAEEVFIWMQQELTYENQITEYINEQLNDMTMEQKLAQMMILTNENDITAGNIQMYQPGGIIFFEVDFRGKTMEQVSNRINDLQSYMEIPLFVAVDEEGGQVSRLKTLADPDIPDFEGARVLCEAGNNAIVKDTMSKMQYFKEMGLNLNFAPVADVVDAKNSYMYKRSASGDAEKVAEYVQTVLSVMQDNQVMGCIKHFPGYSDNINTHNGMASDGRSLSEYREKDFIPFQAGIESGADMVMVSHIIMETVDGENPASLSLKVHDILRDDMGFEGVIIADDLNMQAILQTMTIEEATTEAFLAGNDMIFSADFSASMKGAVEAVNQGTLKEQQVNESVCRILRMKIDNGFIAIEE